MTLGPAPGPGVAGPLVIAADAEAFADARRHLGDTGWHLVEMFTELPRDPWDLTGSALVVAGAVGASDVGDAVAAAARGAGLLVEVAIVDPIVAEGLVDQLARLRPVRDAAALVQGSARRPLTGDEAALLDALGDGASIPAAADALFLSLRTANRRLASARAALGVTSTRAAVIARIAGTATSAGLPDDGGRPRAGDPGCSGDPGWNDRPPRGEG